MGKRLLGLFSESIIVAYCFMAVGIFSIGAGLVPPIHWADVFVGIVVIGMGFLWLWNVKLARREKGGKSTGGK